MTPPEVALAGCRLVGGRTPVSAFHRGEDKVSLRKLELRVGERAVAMKCNLIAGPAIFCFKIGHDASLARYSPGIQLELENVELFHRSDAAWMDSCAQPDNAMINRLWPDRRRTGVHRADPSRLAVSPPLVRS